MNLEQRLAELEAAALKPGGLALRVVEQVTSGDPDLLRALEAAAVPHWWDAAILAQVLDPDLAPAAETWAARLRDLSVVEPFRSQPGASNVHEVTRLALREKLLAENRLIPLAARAASAFPFQNASPSQQIEHLYHFLLAQPESGVDALEDLYREWGNRGLWAAKLDLAAMLEEVLPALAPPARARALLRRASIRSDRSRLGELEAQVLERKACRSSARWARHLVKPSASISWAT